MPRGRAGDGGPLTAAPPPASRVTAEAARALPMALRLRAGLTSLLVPPLLEVVSYARIARALELLARRVPADAVDPETLARWVDRFLGRLPRPWAFTCLRRATVLYHLLRAARMPIDLCIGVRRDLDGSLHAHAWLLRDDVLFLEPARIAERVASFSELARFPAKAPPMRTG